MPCIIWLSAVCCSASLFYLLSTLVWQTHTSIAGKRSTVWMRAILLCRNEIVECNKINDCDDICKKWAVLFMKKLSLRSKSVFCRTVTHVVMEARIVKCPEAKIFTVSDWSLTMMERRHKLQLKSCWSRTEGSARLQKGEIRWKNMWIDIRNTNFPVISVCCVSSVTQGQ